MSCQAYIEQIHCYIDGELPGGERDRLEKHLHECQDCRKMRDELLLVRQALGAPVRFPEFNQKTVWQNVSAQRRRTWSTPVKNGVDLFLTWVRDVDRRLIWSKLVATPVTMAGFALLLFLLPGIRIERWTYSAFMLPSQVPQESQNWPVMIHAVQPTSNTKDLMEKIWQIPYEDSLSFVAEITPEGHAEIGDILEYPKSPSLLEAFDNNLRTARFERAENEENPYVLYQFQKIDVYEGGPVSSEAGL